VWTDGEDLEGHARDAIDDLRRAGLKVLVVGVGTPAGDVIPLLDVSGVTVDVKHDEKGAVVRSRLDEGLLRELARATHGSYFSAGRSGGELARLASALGSLARSRHGTRLVERPVARFPLCALLAGAALIAFLGLPRRRIARRSVALSPAPVPRAAAAGLVLALLLPGTARAQSDWARGDGAFRRGDWVRAESLYARRARGRRPPPGVLANLSTAHANQAPADSLAEPQLASLAARDDDAGTLAGYNLGTLLGRRGELERALAELRRTLERSPGDVDARWNYELLQRRLKQAQASSRPKPSPAASAKNDQQPARGTPPPGQGPSGGLPQPEPPQNAPAPTAESQAPPAGPQQPMTRDQAERLLGSLGDLERLEQQNRRRTHLQREKKVKDW